MPAYWPAIHADTADPSTSSSSCTEVWELLMATAPDLALPGSPPSRVRNPLKDQLTFLNSALVSLSPLA